jgi:NAD(P)-dependent dehydrogenase (short-subunit alcohol dehydrogenase family)
VPRARRRFLYYQAMIDIRGKPIAITGASSGIGRATALACARAGMPVAVAARREDRLADLVREIISAGGRAVAIRCDVVNQDECDNLIARTVQEFGSLYSVFANAGIGHESRIARMTDREMRDIFEINYFGTLNTLRPAMAPLLQSRGHILICSSCLSKIGMPFHGAYTATKAAQEHIARAMRIELKPQGVRVSSVHPVGTATEFFEAKAARTGTNVTLNSPPKWAMQPPERVADAIVRCLRRPRPEVWTSWIARLVFAAADISPRFTDRGLTKFAHRHPRE